MLDLNDKIVLICGCPRSGTTATARYLEQCGGQNLSESWLIPLMGDVVDLNSHPLELTASRFRRFNKTNNKAINLPNLVFSALWPLRTEISRQFLIEKTPANIQYIDHFLHDQRYFTIILKRNPIDILESICNTWNNGHLFKMYLHIHSVRCALKKIREIEHTIGKQGDNFIILDYEQDMKNLLQRYYKKTYDFQTIDLQSEQLGDPYQNGKERNNKLYKKEISVVRYYFYMHIIGDKKSENQSFFLKDYSVNKLNIYRNLVDLIAIIICYVILITGAPYMKRIFKKQILRRI